MTKTIGLIGKSGKFYECSTGMHVAIAHRNIQDAPFVSVYLNDPVAPIVMTEVEPTLAQIETIKKLCEQKNLIFDDVAVHPIFDNFKVQGIAKNKEV